MHLTQDRVQCRTFIIAMFKPLHSGTWELISMMGRVKKVSD
jgi:hypothetical protein